MTPVGEISWRDGALWTTSPGSAARAWERPADLASARLRTDPAVETLAINDGRDMLTAAFAVLPFVRAPIPEPTFGDAVSPAARAAFRLFLGLEGEGDSFHALRGEPDDFLVFARRFGRTWRVGAFAVEATTLTLRFEDVWNLTPKDLRAFSYSVDVQKDGEPATLADIAPDARIFIDLAANGGFLMTFTP